MIKQFKYLECKNNLFYKEKETKVVDQTARWQFCKYWTSGETYRSISVLYFNASVQQLQRPRKNKYKNKKKLKQTLFVMLLVIFLGFQQPFPVIFIETTRLCYAATSAINKIQSLYKQLYYCLK